MRLKLFKKYFLTTSLIILVSLAFMMLILTFSLDSYISRNKYDSMEKACSQVTDYISVVAKEGKISKNQLSGMLITVARVSDADIFIADDTGRVFACGCEEWIREGTCAHSSTLISSTTFDKAENEDKFISTLDIYEKPHYVTAKSMYNNGNQRYCTVFAAASVSTVAQLLSTITRLYIISAIVPIIIMFFCIYAMTYRLTKPLKQMSEASRAMAKGDFSKRIPVTTDDEIGELAVSFNMMTNSLAQLEGMRKSFVANVSHELKTPMTTIGGFIDGILDGTIEPDKQEYYLGIVSSEVKRLSRLVESMLSMSRLESGEFSLKPEIFDLKELIFTIAISQEQRIENKSLDITGLDELQGISINADKDLIHQVVYNLVDNAVKVTNEGGSIDFGLKSDKNFAVLTVTNSGSGIPEKDLPFIFERFYKVDKSRSTLKNSMGLGLYIAKTIVTAHGGTISVLSKEDDLTTFKITLPINNDWSKHNG